MEQARLNVIWDQLQAGSTQIGSIVGRVSRDNDFIVDLSAGLLWSRSHETDVWRKASPVPQMRAQASHARRSSNRYAPDGRPASGSQ